MRKLRFCLLLAVAIVSGPATVRAEEPTPEQLEFFEQKIRPVLAANCYSCHNSGSKAEGELAVDYRDGLRAGGTQGTLVVPGKPDESLLLKVLRHEIDGLEMPQDGPKLGDDVIADFSRWIAMGAPDPRADKPKSQDLEDATSWEATLERRKEWWCFQPVAKPSIPPGDDAAHPVDRFVDAMLKDAGLEPGPAADRGTLIRRLSFALTGLPPAPQEIDQFLADNSADAYERLVDRLLASERFGERWARHWMDWIRYAESHGSEGDPAIPNAYRYRDYLIRALNDDVSYDQLMREHVAGDLLLEPRVNEALGINESALGTAHWRMVFHGFAPTDALDEKVRFVDDQVNCFSKAFLGLTVSCARCHDHKFDAISQRDYYALFGILASPHPAIIDANTPAQQEKNRRSLAELKHDIRGAVADAWLREAESVDTRLLSPAGAWEKALTDAENPVHALHAWHKLQASETFAEEWEQYAREWNDEQQRAAHTLDSAIRRWRLSEPEDYSQWFSEGNGLSDAPAKAGEFAVAASDDKVVAGVYPAGAYPHLLSIRHRGVLNSPRFALGENQQLWLRVVGQGGLVRYVVQDYPRDGTVYPFAELKDDRWQWRSFDLAYWAGDSVNVEVTTAADSPVLARDKDRSWFGVRDVLLLDKTVAPPAESREHLGPLFAVAMRQAPASQENLAAVYSRALADAVRAWQDNTATDGQALFIDAFLQAGLLSNSLEAVPAARPLVEEYHKLESEIPEPARIAGLAEADSYDQPLFVRGNHKQPADPVARRFLEAIDSTPYQTQQSGRLELAADLVRPDNPLPARVIVNRLWHHLFGRGIVSTPDNFGRLGDQPSHPELLDYLATRIVEHGWSIKDTIRFLVTSEAWQRSSEPSDNSREVDPENRLLSHFSVHRLEAEAIRDALLAVSGQLDVGMYGPAVPGTSPRRSVYVQANRNSLDLFLRVFDLPEPFATVGRRDATNTPAQSLAMMNDPQVEGFAEAWSGRILGNASLFDDAQRIDAMFLAAIGRHPTRDESAAAQSYLKEVTGERSQQQQELASLDAEASRTRSALNALFEPIRAKIAASRGKEISESSPPAPVACWEFETSFEDSIGKAHGVPAGAAKVEYGALVVDGRSAYVTAPFDRALTAKTLEAWVTIDGLDQQGGGIMTVQTPDGQAFDSIVFAEQTPRKWLAGSDFFRRTRPFDGLAQDDADTRQVHVAIAYHGDGQIVGYVDGVRYGTAYNGGGPLEFAAGSIVSFGVRHLPAGGNRMLKGRIWRAQLYDRALSDEEVRVSAGNVPVSDAEVFAAASPETGQEIDRLRQELVRQNAALDSLKTETRLPATQAAYMDLARAIFCFKEFLYVQ